MTERLLQTLPQLAARTISCAHPIGRWHGDGFRNCGYCYPCIIRQAGFHHTGSDPTAYGTDPFTDPDFYTNHPDASSDIRSVARFLLEPVRLGDLFATGPIGNYATALALHDMRVRGVAELTRLFRTRLSPLIQNLLGL